MTALSELLHEANVHTWSTREIARRAEKNGHKLSAASASVYMGGRHGTPSEAVLAAFSDVLNIPIDKLREAAGVPTGADSPWTPPSEANRLDLRQRRALEELIRSMVTSEATGEDRTDDDQNAAGMARDAEPDGITSVARRARAYLEKYLLTDERWPDRELLPPAITEMVLDRYSQHAAQFIATGMLSEPIALPTVVNQAAELLEHVAREAGLPDRPEREHKSRHERWLEKRERLLLAARPSDGRPRLLDDSVDEDILELPYAADDSEDPGEDHN